MSEKRYVVETTHSKNKVFDEDRIDFLKSILYKAQVGIKLLLHVKFIVNAFKYNGIIMQYLKLSSFKPYFTKKGTKCRGNKLRNLCNRRPCFDNHQLSAAVNKLQLDLAKLSRIALGMRNLDN